MTTEHESPEPSTLWLVLIGLLGSMFFSATFILNYTMHLGGGHWYWSGGLRFLFMILLLVAILIPWLGFEKFQEVLSLFRKHFLFWLLAGTVGFGFFYAGIVFAADYARGWVVAATWQSTILFTPLVLILMGFSFPIRGIFFSLLIVLGVVLVNIDGFASGLVSDEIKFGVLPILISAFCYPVGNQLLNASKNGTLSYVPHIKSDLLKSPLVCIFLMSLGSAPFWILLALIASPPVPSAEQWISTFFVALLAGIAATGLFFYARNLTASPYKIAAVDATLSGEVLIPLLFEVVVLGESVPEAIPLLGFVLIVGGLVAYTYRTTVNR